MVQFEVTEPNTRLDSIVQTYYGNLEHLSQVLDANPTIDDVFIPIGHKVNLPYFAATKNKEDALW